VVILVVLAALLGSLCSGGALTNIDDLSPPEALASIGARATTTAEHAGSTTVHALAAPAQAAPLAFLAARTIDRRPPAARTGRQLAVLVLAGVALVLFYLAAGEARGVDRLLVEARHRSPRGPPLS
jgi:hypothetical protein